MWLVQSILLPGFAGRSILYTSQNYTNKTEAARYDPLEKAIVWDDFLLGSLLAWLQLCHGEERTFSAWLTARKEVVVLHQFIPRASAVTALEGSPGTATGKRLRSTGRSSVFSQRNQTPILGKRRTWLIYRAFSAAMTEISCMLAHFIPCLTWRNAKRDSCWDLELCGSIF